MLPLKSSMRYSKVEALHIDVDHKCSITPSMWKQAFGSYELIRMHGTIKGHKVHVLVHDNAPHNFLNYELVKKLKLLQTPSSHSNKVKMIQKRKLCQKYEIPMCPKFLLKFKNIQCFWIFTL